MTTSHRPQLEARNGAKGSYVPTSTEHARLLPGHTKLKYRKRKESVLTDNISEDIKTDNKRLKVKNGDSFHEDVRPISTGDEDLTTEVQVNTGEESRENSDDSEDGSGTDSENGFSDTSDDEEDQEALLRELNKIRQERMLKKIKEQQSKEDLEEVENVTPSVKENWRSQAVFGRHKKGSQPSPGSSKKENRYTNNLTKSEYHQEFLHKFVK